MQTIEEESSLCHSRCESMQQGLSSGRKVAPATSLTVDLQAEWSELWLT